VEDVLQEAYFLAYRKLAGLRDQASFKSWLYRIAIREAGRARARSQKFWKNWFHSEAIESVPQDRPDPLTTIAQRDEAQQLLAAIPAQERTALLLYAEGWSYEEICQTLHRSMGTVSTWIRRARLRIQDRMSDAPGVGKNKGTSP
jgi:RNA polymerase sigma-70 factor (ECF subfamily)